MHEFSVVGLYLIYASPLQFIAKEVYDGRRMKDTRPHLVASETEKHPPLLIIDKKGTMGLPLVNHLREQFLLVFVTGQKVPISRQVIHIPYHKKIPRVPDDRYSHMFVFYNGEEETLDMLPALLKKATQTNSKLLFITSLIYTSPQLFQRLSHYPSEHFHTIVYGEVFSSDGQEHNITTMFLHQAKKFGRIEIPNNGVGKLYPILLDDVFSAIIATAFASERRPHLLCVFPPHAVSELSIARMLQKHNPLLKLDFRKYKGKLPSYHLPTGGVYYYPDYPIEEKIRKVAKSFTPAEHVHRQRIRKRYTLPNTKTNINYRVFWITLLTVLLFPILLTAFIGVTGVGALQLSVREIEKGNIKPAEHYASFGANALVLSDSIGSSLFYLDPFVKSPKEAFLTQIRIAKRLAQTEVEMLTTIETLQKVSEGRSTSPKKDFQEALSNLKNSLIIIQKMRAEGELPRKVAAKLENLSPMFVPLQNTIDSLPAIAGFEGKRTYLVLFQNNMELRPGGGFIGSYGLLTLDQGRVKEFTMHDVYDADGRLTAHVEPPYGLRRYLGASHWFLRDSNFAIDFPQNARQAATFLQLETGKTVDGVIAVDTSFLKNILSATGPVTVSDYKEVVTAENFYLRTQTYAEKDFFPGSTQKKDFLRSLLTSLQEKLAKKDGVNFQQVVSKIGESILEKHVIFVFTDTATQQLFAVNNLSSSLLDIREEMKDTYLDFLGVTDANVGVNKANYYLKRAIDQAVVWGADGKLTTTVTVTYENTSKKDSQFGGDYKNYVRFALPRDVHVRYIAINGVKQTTIPAITDPAIFTSDKFVMPKELEIETSREEGKDVIGFLVLVPAGKSKTVTVSYDAFKTIDGKEPAFSYDLRLFKQPGTLDDPYSFSFVFPASYQVVRADSMLSNVGGKLVYSGVLAGDKNMRIEFSKK